MARKSIYCRSVIIFKSYHLLILNTLIYSTAKIANGIFLTLQLHFPRRLCHLSSERMPTLIKNFLVTHHGVIIVWLVFFTFENIEKLTWRRLHWKDREFHFTVCHMRNMKETPGRKKLLHSALQTFCTINFCVMCI